MKIGRLFTIDHEIALRLNKEPNQSGLVNDLLLNHYNQEDKKPCNDPKVIEKYNELLLSKKAADNTKKKHKAEGEAKMQEWRDGKITEKKYWKWVDGR